MKKRELAKKKIRECDKGYKGNCCCLCKHQRTIHAHPQNKRYPFRGSIKESFGWGCLVFIEMEKHEETIKQTSGIIFSDREHGICECFERN